MYLKIQVRATSGERPSVRISDDSVERRIADADNVPPSDLLNLAGVIDNLLPLDDEQRNSQGDGPVARHVRAELLKTMREASREASTLVENSAEKLRLSRDIASAVGA